MCFSDIIYITFQKYDFFHNHQENHKKSATYQQIATKSTVNNKLLTLNSKEENLRHQRNLRDQTPAQIGLQEKKIPKDYLRV